MRKRYRPRGVSPESRAPSFAASNTLKWHPHSKSGCDDTLPGMRTSRSTSVTRSTWHCSCGHVTHSALRFASVRNNTPLMSTRRSAEPAGARARGAKVGLCDKRHGMPWCGHRLEGNPDGSRQHGIADRRAARGLRPRRSRESEQRERGSDEPPPPFEWPQGVPSTRRGNGGHVNAMFAGPQPARQQSTCASDETLSGTGCGPSPFSQRRRKR